MAQPTEPTPATTQHDSDKFAGSRLQIQTDEGDLQNDISTLVEKIKNINLDVSSIQGTLEDIHKEKGLPASRQLDIGSSFVQDIPNGLELGSSCALKTKLAKLGSILSDTQSSIARLIGDRQRLHVDLLLRTATLALRKKAQTPQGKLPVELWAQIFFLCLPADDFVKPDSREAPLLLCQICRGWRSVATGTPLLWSALSIRGSWRRHIWKASLECWLRRSGNAVLYLDISIPAYMEPSFDTHVMKLITSTADRWYRLRLSLPDNLLRTMLDNYMPALHKLEFSSTYPIAALHISASQAPKMRTVSLLTKPLYPQPLSLPWHQLTHLSSQCWLNVGQHLDILLKCPRLESYSMCLVHADIPPDSRPLLMHHLRHLEIIAFIGSAMGPVLGRLQLPKLTQLSFMVPNESPACGIAGWPKFYVISLIERSSCLLIRVRLKGIDMSGECVQDIEKSIPSLVSVEVL